MKPTSFISQRTPLSVPGLARAVLAEILGCTGDDVGEEFEFDAAEGFAWMRGEKEGLGSVNGVQRKRGMEER